MHPCCYQGLFVRAEASKEAGYVVRPCSTHSKGAQSRLSVSAPLLPYQGTSSRGHALSLREGAPPPPKDHTLSGPPSRQARRRSSERPRSVHRSGTGRGLLPVRPPPPAEQGYCRDCDTCDERGNAGKHQHVIEEIGLHGISPEQGDPANTTRGDWYFGSTVSGCCW